MTTEVIEGFQLSPQQEHLWLLQQENQSSTYFVKCTVLIEGNIEITKLVAALQNIVNRHEILRTTFKYVPGMMIPVQVITNANVSLNKQYHLEAYNSQTQEAKIAEIFQEFTQQNFDFEKDSPLHLSLATLSELKHILFIGLPALYGDEKTLRNLVYELSHLYANSEQNLLEPLQYADFSEWQNELIKSEGAEIGREYWCKQDLSDIQNLQLPFEKYIAESQEFKPEFLTLKINPNLKENLAAIAQKYNTSISVFLLTCWSVLLWRLTQQQNLLIGKVFEGRKFPELEDAMGLFAKCLPLTCHLTEQSKFTEILQQISDTEQEIYKWQECFSWELITNQLVYYPVCFDFADKYPKYTDSNISLGIQNHAAGIEQFKIKLSCVDNHDDLCTEFHYDSQRFDAQDIQRLAEQFSTLLESVVKHPEAVISELEILSDRAKHQLLVEFNQTQTDYPKDKCIHQLIEYQAQQQPNNIAVEFEKQKLTYSQLNHRGNQLANYLQQNGVTPGTLIGICVERNLDMIVGILGILKAGGAYIPLDPTYPQERLTWILENSQTSVLLTQQPLLEKLPTHQAQVICLDTDWEIISRQNPENLTLKITPNNLAYIIHTSGSTGKPKGVQITHRNLVHSTTARINYYQKPVSRFLLLSSFAFDSSVAGIFWTLCSGGTLVLPKEGLQLEISKLVKLICENQISYLLSLPSLYALILQQAIQEQLASLQAIIVAGEVCPSELVKLHQKSLPQASLYNEYGPTEATVWSSVYLCQSQELTRVPIGRPIANTQIYILDANLHPVPIGVPGEIYIGGDGISLGYLNQPELSAQKFINNPFSQEPNARLYKTGDLAQYRADGNIEFLGRIDRQVKIRGYRIELGEIEAALKQHPTVREVVVVATEKDKAQPQSIELENPVNLATQLLSLTSNRADQILADIEKLSELEVEQILNSEMGIHVAEETRMLQRLRRTPDFDLSLQIKNPRFISTPLETQRDRLINVALDEFTDDLIHLDSLSKQFVSGANIQVRKEFSQSPVKYNPSQQVFADQQIMEDWQLPLMKAMANIVTETHGDVLEIGFGRGISANYIQELGVKSHTIIECDDHVIEAFYEWKKLYPHQDIRLIKGKWQEVADQLDIYDGIFFHTNILNEEEFVEHIVKSITYAEHFFPTAIAHLKPGGIFTYLSNEIDSFSRRHQRLIFKYFSSLTLSVVKNLSLPENTKDLWWADSMVAVKAIK